jgi:uncharacterized protein (DUF2164 family)
MPYTEHKTAFTEQRNTGKQKMARNNDSGPTRIRLNDNRTKAILRALTDFYSDTFDEELTAFRGRQILRFFLKHLGPPVYNQAVQDARGYMLMKLEDLDGEVYERELPIRPTESRDSQ